MRLKVFHVIILVFFLVALTGLVYTQILKGGFYYRLSKNNCIRIIPEVAKRGLILDRQGEILADSRISFNLAVIPQELKDKDLTFQLLAQVLGKNPTALEKEYRKNMNLPFVPVVIDKGIEKKLAIILEQKKEEFPGVIIGPSSERFYPHYGTNAHILGYLREIDASRIVRLKDYGYKVKDMVGYSGIEEFYDKELRGKDGGTQIEVDNKSRPIRVIALKPAQKGKDIRLTIDLRIQKIASELLEGRRGSIIVMDAFNGEILAMVSSPTFNLDVFINQAERGQINKLSKDPNAPFLNRAISGLYSLGSVFKTVVAIAALDSAKITEQSHFFCDGKLSLGSRDFNCWSKHDNQNIKEAIVHSCNVFFYHLGLLLGPELLNKYALNFGLGTPTGIDLPFELKGIVPSRTQKRLLRKEAWYQGDTLNFSIGQGDLLVTPLQAVKMMAIIINNGLIIRPHLIKAIDSKEVNFSENPSRVNIRSEILSKLKSYLREVVGSQTGTAHILDMANLSIGGKTGTVQTGEGGRQHAWFVGFCPFEKPKIVFCVFLERGGSSSESCIIAKKMLEEMIKQGFF
ncbi:MAG: penicillin-binding protein 2 [Candidatus Omnitrophota bacterium]|nr:penicillin-binding protein 2 [Candidatus Omnitrophota bacterium]